MTTRHVRVVGLVAAALVLSGCTFVPTDAQPRLVPNANVPFGLLSTRPPDRSGRASVTIWLVGPHGTFVGVARQLARPVTAADVATALLRGATNSEKTSGLHSELSSLNLPVYVARHDNDLTVELHGQLPANTKLFEEACGQLVLSVSRGSRATISITVDGKRQSILGPNGAVGSSTTATTYSAQT